MTPSRQDDAIGHSQLPLREAFAFAWQSLWLRMGRMLVVVLGIAFALAFLAVMLGMETAMRGMHEIARAGGEEEAAESFRRWWVVVALLIAMAGVTNAVLMSVTERVKEIGTMKCLGARGRHIVTIFLFETLLLGAAGGVTGGLLGVMGTLLFFGLQLGGDVWAVFGFGDALRLIGVSVAVSLVVSLLAAVIPVSLAARIEPAEAMRYEV